jgi:hypothetical protein
MSDVRQINACNNGNCCLKNEEISLERKPVYDIKHLIGTFV